MAHSKFCITHLPLHCAQNLDIKDREQLRQRIRQLAEGNAVSPSPNPAPPSI
jgi:hypothetical protein